MKILKLTNDVIFWKALGASSTINLFNLVVGFTQGYSAILLPELKVLPDTASWIAGLAIITSPIGALLSGFLMDKFGRKTAIQLAYAPFLVGWLMIATAEEVTNLCLGRAVTGVAVGMGAASYVYVAEVSRSEDRGLFSLFGPTFVSIGVLIIYVLGYIIHWRATATFSFVCCVIGCLLLLLIPESPIWLKDKGQETEAVKACQWFKRDPIEFNNNSNSSEESPSGNVLVNFINNFMSTKSWKPLLILILFFVLQVGSGVYEVTYYAIDFIEKSGSRVKPHIISISLAVMRAVMSIIGSLAIKNFNRRFMIALSASGMGLTMFLSGLYEFFYENINIEDRPYDIIPQVLLLLNIVSSMLGVLQLPWALSGELFPLCIRGVMNGIVPSFGYISIFTMVKLYPFLLDSLNMFGSMWLFTGFSIATILFGRFILPETRGKSLKEIELIFKSGSKS